MKSARNLLNSKGIKTTATRLKNAGAVPVRASILKKLLMSKAGIKPTGSAPR